MMKIIVYVDVLNFQLIVTFGLFLEHDKLKSPNRHEQDLASGLSAYNWYSDLIQTYTHFISSHLLHQNLVIFIHNLLLS